MNTTLLAFVILYLLGTMAIGIYAGTRIHNTTDFAVAGRSLPLAMVITTTFATWFGAETVMGIPARFAEGGLNAIVEDPFGASMCLVLVGAFFAARLYKMSLLTIGDFYRHRFGKGVEIFCSVAVILSYLGWVAAQIRAVCAPKQPPPAPMAKVDGSVKSPMVIGVPTITDTPAWA